MVDKTRTEQFRRRRHSSLLDREILLPAIVESFKKLDPRWQARNPVMFVVEVGSVITTIAFLAGLFQGAGGSTELFVGQVTIWLWFTVLFANFAEAVAEGRGKAQAAALRRTREELKGKLVIDEAKGVWIPVPAHELEVGQRVLVEAGDVIPSDGEVVEGVASVN